MNNRIPEWSAWKAPDPSPFFDQRVWQKLEAANTRSGAPLLWWERWAIPGALAGSAALILFSIFQTTPHPGRGLLSPVGHESLTRAYVTALKGEQP